MTKAAKRMRPVDEKSDVLRARRRLLAMPTSCESDRGVGLADEKRDLGGFMWVIVAQLTVEVAGVVCPA
jgi:hypothetical protein